METRREILDSYLTWRGALGDADQRTLAGILLNRAYRHIWLMHPFNDHRLPNPIEITTVAGTRSYILPQYFGRIPPRVTHVRNLTTGRLIDVIALDALQALRPDTGTSLEAPGVPTHLAVGGSVGVGVQPTAAGQALEVVSDDAGDTDVRVLVEGLDSTDQWNETQVTLNGTTAVAIGTWKPPLVNFGKSYPTGTDPVTAGTSSRGTVTLRVAPGGATLQTLLSEESAREFPTVILSPKPAAAGEIIGIPALRAPKRLLYDADVIPRFWSEALLETMKASWAVSAGDGPGETRPTPAVVQLVAFDNAQQRPPGKRMFR